MILSEIYHNDIPAFCRDICGTALMRRLRDVGMNCGCEYSSTSVFRKIGAYSRYEHSVGAGLIVWHFTHDVRQSIAALLHDVATPCFAHVIDFLHGDYVSQESTEDRTLEIIKGDAELVQILASYGLKPEEVSDYHLFPIADNDTPRLSSDRLEYTLGNGINYGFVTLEDARRLYGSLEKGVNDEGAEELIFSDEAAACEFARLSLRCSKIYSGDEDRYLMQRLAELMRDCVSAGLFTENDLYSSEPEIIARMAANPRAKAAWEHFRSISGVRADGLGPEPRTVNAKKRRIDPFVKGKGRVTTFDMEYKNELQEYLNTPYDYPVSELI